MRAQFKRLTGDTIVYGIGGVATRFIGFLLLPIYTRVFNPADYGVMDVIASMTALAGLILTAGTETALSYYFFHLEQDREQTKTVTSTAAYLIAVNGLVAGGVWLGAGRITAVLFGDARAAAFLRLAVLAIPFASLLGLNLNVLRLIRRPWSYVGLTLSQFMLSVVLNIYLVVFLRTGIAGVFWTNLVTTALFAVASTALNRRYFRFDALDRVRIAQVVRYGAPLVIGGLSMWSIDSLDRYFLLHYASLQDVGLYSVAARLASGVAFATWAFRLANAPFQFEIASAPEAPRIYSRTLNYYALLVSTLCVLLALFARPVLRVVTTEAYVGAHRVVGLMAFSAVAYGLYQIVGVGLLIRKRTFLTGAAIGTAAVLNVTFQFTLVPRLGMTGAALAVLLTHICVVAMLYVGAQRTFFVPYELGFVTRVVVPAGAAVVLRLLVTPVGIWLDLSVAVALFGGYAAALGLLGAVSAEQVRLVREMLRGRQRTMVASMSGFLGR